MQIIKDKIAQSAFRGILLSASKHAQMADTIQIQVITQHIIWTMLGLIVKLQHTLETAISCTICRVTLWADGYACKLCGLEFCTECTKAGGMEHLAGSGHSGTPSMMLLHTRSKCTRQQADQDPAHVLFPITLWGRRMMAKIDKEVRSHYTSCSSAGTVSVSVSQRLQANIASLVTMTSGYREITTASLTAQAFEQLWSLPKPLLVSGCSLAVEIGPDYFRMLHGRTKCELEDCENGTTQRSTLAAFFERFGEHRDEDAPVLKLKVCLSMVVGSSIVHLAYLTLQLQDWPTYGRLQEVDKHLYEAYCRAVPAPDWTRTDGVFNLSAYLPWEANIPDLGPKLYAAYKGRQGEGGHGSTVRILTLTLLLLTSC
jgi:hypothetical protein